MLSQELEYSEDPAFKEFINFLVQRGPRYTVKQSGKHWKTKQKALSDTPIRSHLEGKYYIGTLAKWYPNIATFDFDDVSLDYVERTRDSMRLDSSNSMLCKSESTGSYHLHLTPSYNGKPVTTRLLQNIVRPFAQQHNIEIYPQLNRAFRLPFGKNQDCIDLEYIQYKKWQEQLYWLMKIDPFDLKTIPYHQQELDFNIPVIKQPGAYRMGKQLLETGLDSRNSRHEAQYCIAYYNWASTNMLPDVNAEIVFNWVITKHNGYSTEVNSGNYRTIKEEIKRQIQSIYSTYEHSYFYPNEVNNSHNGYITKADIAEIVKLSKANLPRVNFLYNLVKYCYPRRYRTFVNISSDKLKEWSQRNYLQYLEEFKGIINRGESYQVDKFSKSIKLNWNYRDSTAAILDDDRAPDTINETIRLSYQPEELRELLTASGSKRDTAIKTVKRLYESGQMYTT